MKETIIAVFMLAAVLFIGKLGGGEVLTQKGACPSCGAENVILVDCPVCNSKVCELCADDDSYIEKIYESDDVLHMLERSNYIVFSADDAPACVNCSEPHRAEDMRIVGDYFVCANCIYFFARDFSSDEKMVQYIENNCDMPYGSIVTNFR